MDAVLLCALMPVGIGFTGYNGAVGQQRGHLFQPLEDIFSALRGKRTYAAQHGIFVWNNTVAGVGVHPADGDYDGVKRGGISAEDGLYRACHGGTGHHRVARGLGGGALMERLMWFEADVFVTMPLTSMVKRFRELAAASELEMTDRTVLSMVAQIGPGYQPHHKTDLTLDETL